MSRHRCLLKARRNALYHAIKGRSLVGRLCDIALTFCPLLLTMSGSKCGGKGGRICENSASTFAKDHGTTPKKWTVSYHVSYQIK